MASPWLWNIIADQVHEKVGALQGINTIGYADDTVVYISSQDPQAAVNAMNSIALPVVLEWATEFGLEIAPEKTVAMLYTRRHHRKPEGPFNKDGTPRGSYDIPSPVRFMDRDIEWSKSQKHLGVFIEKRLNFADHIRFRVKKAKGLLIQLRNCMGKVHGLQPASALKLYKWCRSMLVHGCLVWHQEVYKTSILKMLRSFQSAGLRTMGIL